MRFLHTPLMLVISSPSGAGKSSITKALLAREPALTLSVSATTRPKRATEQDGREYHFVTHEAFDAMIAQDAFLEHAKVFKERYGTPKSAVLDQLSQGKDVVFDIDWQGAEQLSQQLLDRLVRIFILPPSLPELHRRLQSRAADSAEIIQHRMLKAKDEISHYGDYDYVLVNDDIEACTQNVQSILHAERLKRLRNPALDGFVERLLQEDA